MEDSKGPLSPITNALEEGKAKGKPGDRGSSNFRRILRQMGSYRATQARHSARTCWGIEPQKQEQNKEREYHISEWASSILATTASEAGHLRALSGKHGIRATTSDKGHWSVCNAGSRREHGVFERETQIGVRHHCIAERSTNTDGRKARETF